MNTLATPQSIELDIEGMSCASCVNRIEKALKGNAGVLSVTVNFATESASIEFNQQTSQADLIRVIEEVGYAASLHNDASVAVAPAKGGSAFLLSALFTLPLVLPMIGHWFDWHWAPSITVQWLLASMVQFYFGLRFYKGAWSALKARSGNMDSLVAIGTSAAYFLSVFHILNGQSEAIYFESSAVIITLVILGKWMEARAKNQTTSAIRALQSLRPEKANLLVDGEEKLVDASRLAAGDLILIKAGEKVAADGEIQKGISFINEALITGESVPVEKHPGDKVIGGSMNLDGLLTVKVSASSSESTLSKIIRLVESAQQKKSPTQKLVDRVSAIFVPVVLLISAITLISWGLITGDWTQAIINSVAVLVIACPCALGLATPTAIMVGTGLSAKRGILIKDAEVLEFTEHVDVVAFDKTGTLTEGKPRVEQINTFVSNENDLLSMLKGLQQGSEHPLAKAVIAHADNLGIQADAFELINSLPGKGIYGEQQGTKYWFGNKRLMLDIGIDAQTIATAAERFAQHGNTLSWVAIQREPQAAALYGLVQFQDKLKASARETIDRLHAANIQTVLLTGDTQTSADLVAKQLGLDTVMAEILPEHKADAVAQLKAEGKRVAMVGDGINDTPALATADVGIAMGGGTDIAMQTAGITLMHSDPIKVIEAIEIARKTQGKIRQNLFWAFIYNIVGIPLAALGFLNPMMAGAIMAISSVSVILNALLLNYAIKH